MLKRRDLEKKLTECGWRFARAGGRHDVWTNGEREEAVPRHREIRVILRRAAEIEAEGQPCSTRRAGIPMEIEMRFEGRVVRDGRIWLAEIPLLEAMTQGKTRAEALEMIADWVETMVNRPGFHAQVHPRGRHDFEISGNDVAALTALLLRRRREASGASLRDVADRLGATSRNSYARYERGDVVPTVEKLDALLKATLPEGDFVIREASR